MKNEKIFITGGAGYLGKHLIKKLYLDNEITVYSRDEAKHYFLKKLFPNVNFIIGDVRNRDLLLKVSKKHTIGVFAASMKQIDACTNNYEEASNSIIQGAFNSRFISEENNFKSACFISSDKSRAATTIYGAMKYVAGESFIVGKSSCKLTTAIYGNVMNSTGSIIPLIWNNIDNKNSIPLYDVNMTRFLLDIDDAVNLVINSSNYSNCNIISKSKSFKIIDLFDIYKENFGLKYHIDTPRTGEKIHEIMASSEEIARMNYDEDKNFYLMYPDLIFKKLIFPNNEYSSRDFIISKNELYEYLLKHNFYKNTYVH